MSSKIKNISFILLYISIWLSLDSSIYNLINLTYEDFYNSGIGSNGLTSARHDVFNKKIGELYPETYDLLYSVLRNGLRCSLLFFLILS